MGAAGSNPVIPTRLSPVEFINRTFLSFRFALMQVYYVYILESLTSGKWYYGSSSKLLRRIDDHQSNRARYTRFKGPWTLIFVREFDNKADSLQFERYLKRLRNKSYIQREFSEYFDVSRYRDMVSSDAVGGSHGE